MGLNSPPFFDPGFKSQMSIVGGPPLIHSRMHAFWFLRTSAALALEVIQELQSRESSSCSSPDAA